MHKKKKEAHHIKSDIYALILAVITILLFLSLISYSPSDPSFFAVSSLHQIHNYAGLMGSYLADLLFQIFGYGAWLIVLLLFYFSIILFAEKEEAFPVWRIIGGLFSLVIFVPPLLALIFPHRYSQPFFRGGLLGKFLGEISIELFGPVGTYFVLAGIIIISLVYATGISFIGAVRGFFKGVVTLIRYRKGSIKGEVPPDDSEHIEKTRRTIDIKSVVVDKKKGDSSTLTGRAAEDSKEEKPFVMGEESSDFTVPEFKEESTLTEETGSEIKGASELLSGSDYILEEDDTTKEDIEIYEVKPTREKRRKNLPVIPREFEIPSVSLLEEPEKENVNASEEKLKRQARILRSKLAEFKVDGKVTGILPGPIITRYEFVPAPGIKVSNIVNLADDLSMALKASKVRISVISRKGVLGIEVPNEKRRVVRLREILESDPYNNRKLRLPLILGLDISGVPVVEDLVGMPHILIAGMTGSGKSVGINSIIMGLIYRHTPKTLRFVLVDPKLVELSVYSDIPHLLLPVISESDKAVGALRGIVEEMERRYSMLRLLKVRNIEEYNTKFEKIAQGAQELWIAPENELFRPDELEYDEDGRARLESLPYIVVIIDEYSDLMFATGKKVEEFVARLAQKARAAGIHIILATQRPSAKVVTGIIKANLPARIAYNVRSATDSRIILDDPGASQLLGKGDMLFLHPSRSELRRIQGPLVTLDEVRRVVDFWKKQGRPMYREDLIKLEGEEPATGGEDIARYKDNIYFRALRIAMEEGEISASKLQRRLGIGYNRAARYVEIMEREGIISHADGAKPRKVLKYIDVDRLEDE